MLDGGHSRLARSCSVGFSGGRGRLRRYQHSGNGASIQACAYSIGYGAAVSHTNVYIAPGWSSYCRVWVALRSNFNGALLAEDAFNCHDGHHTYGGEPIWGLTAPSMAVRAAATVQRENGIARAWSPWLYVP